MKRGRNLKRMGREREIKRWGGETKMGRMGKKRPEKDREREGK